MNLYTVCIVKDYVRSRRQSTREAFVPLHHPPGHAQVDFGEAVVELRGQREKVAFFGLILPHSNVWFVKAYPRETTEAFLDGHVSAFAFLGGVPRSILYDNTTLAVARILGCQSTFSIDPQSACKIDPPECHGGGCPGSQ